MRKQFLHLFALLTVTTSALGQTTPQLPSTVYIWPMGNFAQNAMMSSLAGVVNRSTNGELLLSPDNGSQPNPRFWLDRLKEQYPTVQSQVQSNITTRASWTGTCFTTPASTRLDGRINQTTTHRLRTNRT